MHQLLAMGCTLELELGFDSLVGVVAPVGVVDVPPVNPPWTCP